MPDLRIATVYCIEIAESYTLSGHMKALGEYLVRTGTTQTTLARRVGVSQPTISDLVNGKASASARVLRRISMATGLSVDELLADETGLLPCDEDSSDPASHVA